MLSRSLKSCDSSYGRMLIFVPDKPLARLVVMLSWHIGVVLDMAPGPYASNRTACRSSLLGTPKALQHQDGR
ncbi:MAG: hypothetical protein ABGZ35_14410 [Planctomycetaceae bacterium]